MNKSRLAITKVRVASSLERWMIGRVFIVMSGRVDRRLNLYTMDEARALQSGHPCRFGGLQKAAGSRFYFAGCLQRSTQTLIKMKAYGYAKKQVTPQGLYEMSEVTFTGASS